MDIRYFELHPRLIGHIVGHTHFKHPDNREYCTAKNRLRGTET